MLQVMLQVPMVFQTTGDLADTGYAAPSASGLGTPTAAARVGLLTQDEAGGLDVAMELGAGLPVGSEAVLARDNGMLRLSPKVMVGRHFGFIRAGLEVGFMRRLRQRITRHGGESIDAPEEWVQWFESGRAESAERADALFAARTRQREDDGDILFAT